MYELLSRNSRQTVMGYLKKNKNMIAFMPRHTHRRERQKRGGERQADRKKTVENRLRIRESEKGESIANGIGIRFIPKMRQQKEAGRKPG